MSNNKTVLLTNTEGTIVEALNGVTYFKLHSDFNGDTTKNCGLLGEEIDKNFYFLRGYDIKNASLEEDTLRLNRVDENYPPLEVSLSGLTNITPSNKVLTDDTLVGNGTKQMPLGLSPIAKTGMFAPVSEYIDLSSGGTIPEDRTEQGKGYRVLTKEAISNYGRLYTYADVNLIKEKLADSEWRVPTKEDWDELLNAYETEENQNHNTAKAGYYGEQAGIALKSVDEWAESSVSGEDIEGFNLLPVGHKYDKEHSFDGLGLHTVLWTDTRIGEGDVYTKKFTYDEGGVFQKLADVNEMNALRLVKDYDGTNFKGNETIMSLSYDCVLPQNTVCADNYSKIWTKSNIAEIIGESILPEEWIDANSENLAYFINEWNGSEWVKYQLKEGESVVILHYVDEDDNSIDYKEWRIVNGDLNNVLKSLEDKIASLEEQINLINTDITAVVKNILNGLIIGTEGEISVKETENNIQIGFDENAIFGNI